MNIKPKETEAGSAKALTIFQVDAFTNEPFKGNPAGVMLVDAETPTEWMQQMAAEMNLSETAFLIPQDKGFRIRYFTPAMEVPLCGHATLSAAHIAFELGLLPAHETLELTADGGQLSVRKEADWLVMDFPAYPIEPLAPHNEFEPTFGFRPTELYSSLYGWVLAVAASEHEIKTCTPNFEAMKSNGLGHVMITAACETDAADFVVRCFAPSAGINEDPVTGSAHCALAPYWAQKLGKTEFDSLQVSKRSGRLKVKLNNNRVEIKGQALTIFEAKLKIHP